MTLASNPGCQSDSGGLLAAPSHSSGPAERAYAVSVLTRLADPVLNALADGKLKQEIPQDDSGKGEFAPLEATGRLLAGMAPWLELGPGSDAEGKLRAHYIDLVVRGIRNAVDPESPDFLNFDHGAQPLVDTAFLAEAFLRAPTQLWGRLDSTTKANAIAAFKVTRIVKPGDNNWLLFSAIVEAALWEFTGECDISRIELAVQKHLDWYKGDGTYGDGPAFHWDYYNSYVIQPMLIDVLTVCARHKHPLGEQLPLILERAQRYAVVQERMISPEGTFPVIGRSSTYRFAAFQTLGVIALLDKLPDSTPPAAVRGAMMAVIHRMIEAPGTFDERGWLRPGVVGYQPALRERYISAGSCYLCAVGLVVLGLSPESPFWSAPDQPWTQQRIWSGENVSADHAIR